MKHSVTGVESGASDVPFITPIDGNFLQTYGITPNDVLKKHRAAKENVNLDTATPFMDRGNFFENGAWKWFQRDFSCKIAHPKIGYVNKNCNLVASLDGIFSKDCIIENQKVPAGSVWECKIPSRPHKTTDSIERILQVQAQLDCADAEYGIIAELAMTDCIWRTALVKRHEATISAIRKAVNVFWEHIKNDTDYPPVTSSEASRLIQGNRRPEVHDLSKGVSDEIPEEARRDMIDAADNYLSAKRAEVASKAMMENSKLTIQALMGGWEKVKLPRDILISHSTVEYKAQPEKTKITPAKAASTSRRFSIKDISHAK